jgi:hypothetical protein
MGPAFLLKVSHPMREGNALARRPGERQLLSRLTTAYGMLPAVAGADHSRSLAAVAAPRNRPPGQRVSSQVDRRTADG